MLDIQARPHAHWPKDVLDSILEQAGTGVETCTAADRTAGSMAEAASPEPMPGMPKRRPAAVSRLTVPNDLADAQHCPGIPSCHSEAERGSWRGAPTPPLSAQQWRAPRLSKPGYQSDPVVYHKVFSIFTLLLLVAVASVSTYRQRQLASVVSAVQQKHKDDLNLQVAWLAASMSEHDQCKAALLQADGDYKAATGGLQKCETNLQKCDADQKQSSSKSEQAAASSRVATAQLRVELDSARKHLKEATERLKKAQGELSTAQQQQVQLQALHQEKEQWLKEMEQLSKSLVTVRSQLAVTPALSPVDHSAPHTAATAAAIQAASTAHPHTDSSSSGSDVPVVVATCSASDLAPHDIITPWCEAVVAAGVPRVMLVSDDAACAAAAKAAGVKVLQHKFEVPAIPGPLAEQNTRVFRRYAALQQVLSLGHAAVSVEPDVLLLSDPLPLLHQHPTDVTVMSTASGDEHSAYGHLVVQQHGGSSTVQSTFQISSFSSALLYLRPQQPTLHFVQAMMDGLAAGHHDESALLNNLLLPPWHVHISPDTMTHSAGTITMRTTSIGDGSSSGSGGGEARMTSLPVPVTVGVLPPSLFTSSEVVFRAAVDPKAWLKQHQPVAVQLLPGANRAAQVQTVLEWLEADIQEVIQMLGQQQQEAGPHAAAAGMAGGGGDGASSNNGLSSVAETAAAGSAVSGGTVAAAKVADIPSQTQPQQQPKQQQEQVSNTKGTTAAPVSGQAGTDSSSSSIGALQAATEGAKQQEHWRPQGRSVPTASAAGAAADVAAAVPVPMAAATIAAAPAKQAAVPPPPLSAGGSTQQMQARGSKLASKRAVSRFGYRRTKFAASAQLQTQKDQSKKQQQVPAARVEQATQGTQQQQQREPAQHSAQKKHRKHVH